MIRSLVIGLAAAGMVAIPAQGQTLMREVRQARAGSCTELVRSRVNNSSIPRVMRRSAVGQVRELVRMRNNGRSYQAVFNVVHNRLTQATNNYWWAHDLSEEIMGQVESVRSNAACR